MKCKRGDWMAWCNVCKGGILVRGIPILKGAFTCWNCGSDDIRKIPGAEVYVPEEAVLHAQRI